MKTWLFLELISWSLIAPHIFVLYVIDSLAEICIALDCTLRYHSSFTEARRMHVGVGPADLGQNLYANVLFPIRSHLSD